MAYIPCIIGGGSQYTETSLWTNASPTSDFAAQTVSLSESIDNFKYIGIKFKAAKTIDSEAKAIFLVDDLKKSLVGNSANHITLSVSSQNDANSLFARTVGYASSTSISFTVANRGASTATYTNQVIPLEIFGLNELDNAGEDPLNPDEVKSTTKASGTNTVTVTFSNSIKRFVISHSGRYWIVQEGNSYIQRDTQSSSVVDRTSILSVSGNTVTFSGSWSASASIAFIIFAWF